MRFYTRQHKHYCGIDLHARTMYLCIMNQAGDVLLHQNTRCNPASFLRAIEPYRESGYRLLMRALEAQGNVAAALTVYDELRRLLRDDIGTAPAAQTQALHKRLLAV